MRATMLLAAGVLATVLTGCDSNAEPPAPAPSVDPCAVASPSPAVEGEPVPDPCAPEPDQGRANPDEQTFISAVEDGRIECDADDRLAFDVPDCGLYVGKTFVWWSWAAAGKIHPPAGWDYRGEARRAYANVSPKRSLPPASAPAAQPLPSRAPTVRPTVPPRRTVPATTSRPRR